MNDQANNQATKIPAGKKLSSAPHQRAKVSVQKVMAWVLIALLPATVAHVVYFGVGLLVQIVIATSAGMLFEFLCLRKRYATNTHRIKPFLSDLSVPVTAVLFALCISPIAPWYVAVVGMFFAIVVAKHLYGGLGHNIFNPAMVGFAVILISFPQSMALWLSPWGMDQASLSVTEILSWVFRGHDGATVDAVTAATPLSALQTGQQQGLAYSEVVTQKIFGDFGGLGWEWVANWLFIGGLVLLYKKIITWHVPVTLLVVTCVFSYLFYAYDSDTFMSPMQHVFSGGLMLAAFFIATDPTSGCSSMKGKLIFAAGVAILTVLIRQFGSFPDGVAFAVLLMNMAAPLIDQLTIPQAYGHKDSYENKKKGQGGE
ncbi:RnfABCDGE type electron transport complex subunit D [Marinicella rhabdoformis]|uniref:RnfABCDGE type electron transport complex subunit D n=1 Tax=Marinicella rhabdoformis TaxID=2580566 RepID=UPI0012AEBE4C|nr:RnfABCDGE type electron transport complex subunit D [Marinicella rhabdoformis]